jgi:glycosyltransferase involved in cell wall biosynthesis
MGEDTEITHVRSSSIGIMPLLDRPFERGKSIPKLIQYMACGLPVMASPVGINSSIVEEGSNGFLATSEQEWEEGLRRLIADPTMRRQLGAEGRLLDPLVGPEAAHIKEEFRVGPAIQPRPTSVGR